MSNFSFHFFADNFNFSQQHSFVFEPAKHIYYKELSFPIPLDNIVELSEFLVLRTSVNDSRVGVYKPTQYVKFSIRDGKYLIINAEYMNEFI